MKTGTVLGIAVATLAVGVIAFGVVSRPDKQQLFNTLEPGEFFRANAQDPFSGQVASDMLLIADSKLDVSTWGARIADPRFPTANGRLVRVVSSDLNRLGI